MRAVRVNRFVIRAVISTVHGAVWCRGSIGTKIAWWKSCPLPLPRHYVAENDFRLGGGQCSAALQSAIHGRLTGAVVRGPHLVTTTGRDRFHRRAAHLEPARVLHAHLHVLWIGGGLALDDAG
jgi:hypothetical protein